MKINWGYTPVPRLLSTKEALAIVVAIYGKTDIYSTVLNCRGEGVELCGGIAFPQLFKLVGRNKMTLLKL